MSTLEKLRIEVNKFLTKYQKPPKYFFIKPNVLIDIMNDYGVDKFYSIVPYYVDARLKKDFILSNKSLNEYSDAEYKILLNLGGT